MEAIHEPAGRARHSVRAGLGFGECGAQRTGAPYHRRFVVPIRVQISGSFPYRRTVIANVAFFTSLSPREGRVGREPERGAEGKTNLLSPALSSLWGREGVEKSRPVILDNGCWIGSWIFHVT